MTTTTTQLRNVLDFAADALAIRGPDQLTEILLPSLSAAVGSDAATLTQLDPFGHHEVAVSWPPRHHSPARLIRYPAVAATHPLRPALRALVETSAAIPEPLRISDVLSPAAWRQTMIHAESHRGIDDQMCLPLAVRGRTVRAVTLSRLTGSFTDTQRDLLKLCRPHLAAAVTRLGQNGIGGRRLFPATFGPDAPAGAAGAPRTSGPGPRALSDREGQVAELVAAGRTDRQIGTALGLRPSTVSSHLRRIYTRLGLANRAELARLWVSARPVAEADPLRSTGGYRIL